MISLFCLFIFSCSGKKAVTLKPSGFEQVTSAAVDIGDLRAVFIDNSEAGPDHRAGYNGISELRHTKEDSGIFVPFYAGFNLEHIFGGDSLTELFEPRRNAMELYRKNNHEILLYQESTPLSHVESLTEFRVTDPHYIDVTFRCIIHDMSFFRHGVAGLFWASYIDRPDDKMIYFRGIEEGISDTSWISAFSPVHGFESTHRAVSDDHELFFAENFNASLASHFSRYRFTESFFYGRYRKMALAYFFDSDEIIRFSQSPTGGGETNPAWDFQYIIVEPEVNREYTFRARMMYKPFVSEEDIENEYNLWKENL